MLVSWKDWTLSHNQDGPVAPRFDVNARDLYIPGLFLAVGDSL